MFGKALILNPASGIGLLGAGSSDGKRKLQLMEISHEQSVNSFKIIKGN